ncbi:Bromodomain associated-domain-containing protein [Syncephalis pseudoplumigaleata]|uniref:Bromodomain associated-domain-containing protein n=1 Tax=Syncephalis pseudoplumigaleata TaxID=1712513 RepID=A0A4P9YS82_9FUNG|nr:Bromodomain associated-domain-containing protein [Syncephalis pseudoplumigaleata]|eukprot:RKP22222.1 Bromodomain associated-domain-containing protein [Syncephalis pseudoplumigaleata]
MAAPSSNASSSSSSSSSSLFNARETADALLEQCVAVICRQCGFDAITRGALDLLKQLVAAYWKEFLGQAARDAELAGRPRPNMNDVRRALERYGLKTVEAHQ